MPLEAPVMSTTGELSGGLGSAGMVSSFDARGPRRRAEAVRLAFQIGDTMSWPSTSDADGVAPPDRESARKREALELFSGLPARYDQLSAAFSLWQDPRWRRALVDAIAPRDGERLLDVATGTGMGGAAAPARAPGPRGGVGPRRHVRA